MQGAFRDERQAERPGALGSTAALQYAGRPDGTGQLNLIQQKLRDLSLEATASDLFVCLVPRQRACRHGIDVVETTFDDTATGGLSIQRLRRHCGSPLQDSDSLHATLQNSDRRNSVSGDKWQ
jgi:hypothetical protein